MGGGDRLTDELKLEEFRQVNEYLRQSLNAMLTIINVSVSGIATLIAAAFALVATRSSMGEWPASHLAPIFLVPLVIVVLSLSLLDAHRHDIYRFQYYLVVFHEEPHGLAAGWGTRSLLFRSRMPGEALDNVAIIYVTLAVISAALAQLFARGSGVISDAVLIGWTVLLPMVVWQARRFSRDRSPIEAQWRQVQAELLARETGSSLQDHAL